MALIKKLTEKQAKDMQSIMAQMPESRIQEIQAEVLNILYKRITKVNTSINSLIENQPFDADFRVVKGNLECYCEDLERHVLLALVDDIEDITIDNNAVAIHYTKDSDAVVRDNVKAIFIDNDGIRV